MDLKLEHKIELVILSSLLLLEVMEFSGLLPTDLEFAKKIISLTALGYLFVKASPTLILFGHKKERFDVAIVLSYFLFITKNIISYVEVIFDESKLFANFYAFLLDYSSLIEKYSFY